MALIYLIAENFFAFVVILSVIVFVHEFGHYFIAKKCGVKIESFSIGFGREIFGWNDKSGTRWKFSLLPFGGYVKMFGDEDPSSSKQDRQKLMRLSPQEKKQTLYFQNVWKRIAVVSAGPIANLLLAIFILTASYKINGITYFKPIVDEVVKGSVAEEADIRAGDLITDVNNKKIATFEELKVIIAFNPNTHIKLGIIRNGKYITTTLTPRLENGKDPFGNELKIGVIGIMAKTMYYEEANLARAFAKANETTYKTCANTLRALGQIVKGKRSMRELGGPLKIAQYSGQSFKKGFGVVTWFIAMISANLGMMNILPIPMLDGGHLLFYVIEAVRRRPVSDEVQEKFYKLGFAFLIGLMIFATFNDLVSIIG